MFGQSKSTAPRLLKFEPPKDPIEEENAKKAWEMPHLDKINYLERKFREKQHSIDSDRNLRPDDKQAIKNAMQIYLQQMQLQAWDAEADECYLKGFRDFLQGKSKYNTAEYKHLVPWTNHALVGKDIEAYIDAVIDKKIEFDMKIAKMFNTKMAPRTLQDAWLYYVFIVTGKRPPTDLFLKAWDAFYPYGDDQNGDDNPMKNWKKHPEDAQKREEQKGIDGPKESCDNGATAQALPGYDTKPDPGHPHLPVTANDNTPEEMETEEAEPAAQGNPVPPLTLQVPEGQAIETEEEEDKEPPPPAQTINVTNNYQTLPPEEFVQRYFAVQDEKFAQMVQEFKISNQEQTKALLQGLGGIVEGLLNRAVAPQTAPTNPEFVNYLKTMERKISQQLAEGFRSFAESNMHLSKAIYDSCSISKNAYNQDKQDPNAGALLEAITAQTKQMAQIQQNLLQSQAQQGDALNQTLVALQSKIEATDTKLGLVVENYAQLANAEATVKYDGLLKLANFTVEALQKDKAVLQQQVVAQNSLTNQLHQQIVNIQQATSSQIEALLKGDRGTQLKIEELGKALTDAANKIGAPPPPQIIFVAKPPEAPKVDFVEEGVEVTEFKAPPAAPKRIEGSPHPPALTYKPDQELLQRGLEEYKAYEERFKKEFKPPVLVDIEVKRDNIEAAQSQALILLNETTRRAKMHKKVAKQERVLRAEGPKSSYKLTEKHLKKYLAKASKATQQDELSKLFDNKKTRESVLDKLRGGTRIEEID
jgi:hypothetical protein